ncbi:unnamed protein product [Heterobilharzia americana]|nr:unnamed protein product [Heterobilharzia americana]
MDIYRKLLNPIYANNTLLTKQCLHIIDISVILQEILLSNRLEENRNNSNLDVNTGDIIKRYIKDKMDELLNNTTALDHSKSIQQNIGIFIDNISSLYDLGVSLRELEYLLSNWFYSPDSNTNISNLLVSIGVHVGENFQDSITSEFEPGFIHFIDLWRSRASIILESKPLTTGYTSLIDGQLICWKRSTLDRLNCKNNITSSVYHFHVEGKRINCYTPGTSKLLT